MDEYIIFASLVLALFAIIFLIVVNIRLSRMVKKYDYFMQGLGEQDVENLMTYYLERLEKLEKDVHIDMHQRISEIERKLPRCIQNTGVVHYNAFDNVGNEMSFSVALMDDRKDGFVFTGIYSRESSYVYTKEIKNGVPQRQLSKEEIEAVKKSLSK